jgi:hypothetical protein
MSLDVLPREVHEKIEEFFLGKKKKTRGLYGRGVLGIRVILLF